VVRAEPEEWLRPDHVSPSDFIAPSDSRLLDRYGGAVPFCGRGDHYIDRLAELPGLRAVNMSQPHLNDLDKIFSQTIGRSLPPLGFDHRRAQALVGPALRRGLVHLYQQPEVSPMSTGT